MTSFKNWRPQCFADIIGAANQDSKGRLQSVAKQRRPLKGILLGRYGTVKTSIARLVLKSLLCQNPDPETADPCLVCLHCKNANAGHNGEAFNYQYWEIDCTSSKVNREFMSGIVEIARSGIDPPILICDELQRMPERSAQQCLLKFAEDLEEGVFIAIATTEEDTDRPIRVLPALFNRLSKFYFTIPEIHEFVDFFVARLPKWNISGSKEDIHEMVVRTERSFRDCFDVLDEALHNNGGKVDRNLIDRLLPKRKREVDDWKDQFEDDPD